jgi:hypothetical protein
MPGRRGESDGGSCTCMQRLIHAATACSPSLPCSPVLTYKKYTKNTTIWNILFPIRNKSRWFNINFILNWYKITDTYFWSERVHINSTMIINGSWQTLTTCPRTWNSGEHCTLHSCICSSEFSWRGSILSRWWTEWWCWLKASGFGNCSVGLLGSMAPLGYNDHTKSSDYLATKIITFVFKTTCKSTPQLYRSGSVRHVSLEHCSAHTNHITEYSSF